MRERRRSLTPLESEPRRGFETPREHRTSRFERLRQRRTRRPPTTLRGAIARGLLRLGIAAGAASGIALLVDHWTGRKTSFGFYVIGAALFAIAFFTSASSMGARPYYYSEPRGERAQRVRMSFAYVLAGAVVIAIGVAIDLL